MNMRTLFAAAAIAALPATGFAAVVADDGSTNVGAGETYTFTGFPAGASTDWQHTFNVAADGGGTASATVGDFLSFTDLVMAWYVDDVLISSEAIDTTTQETVTVGFSGPAAVKLVVTWSSSLEGEFFDLGGSISVVPLPAGALLLGTALAGFGIARRRKSKA